ncbi:calcium-binding protein [Donghicola mangrovi]|uniref:Calcium-binding protein n=1 Tax=Donghicola mangrovi TaxID=2729614 RepID=A0A850QAJ7_9RHOB|nr:calcium-binding protein [Donghicola mangrovi]NVO25332.1 calcium-binding protein [Donghicola mangrovi]
MKYTTETVSIDLSGSGLFPSSLDFEEILSSESYLVSELIEGQETSAFLHTQGRLQFDYDTFVANLDPVDTYQIKLTVSDATSFDSNVQFNVRGSNNEYVGLIFNDYGDIFDEENSLLTKEFQVDDGGMVFIFSGLVNTSTDSSVPYSLELIKTKDVEPWTISLTQEGNGGKATLTTNDQTVSAGSLVEFSVTLATVGITASDVSLVGSGSIYSSQVATENGLTISGAISPSTDLNLSDLLEITFLGSNIAGQVEVVDLYIIFTDLSIGRERQRVPTEISGSLQTPGSLKLDGTESNDTINGDVADDVIVGFGGNDSLFGSTGDDTMNAGAGNDILLGGEGDDLLLGKSGHDQIFGNSGNDILIGGGGSDSLFGGNQKDHLNGGSGNDSLCGEAGNDDLVGGGGSDSIDGGLGRDSLSGNFGKDIIFGGGGGDILIGGGGADTLFGGSGNDRLSGGGGKDLLEGGAGKDRFEFKIGSRTDTILDFEDDIDTLLLDIDLWGGGLRKAQVLSQFATENENGVVLNFGSEKLVIEGLTDASVLIDDIAFI